MSTFTVTKVRKEWSVDGGHRHIEGVCTDTGTHYTRTKWWTAFAQETSGEQTRAGIRPRSSPSCSAPTHLAERRPTSRPTRTVRSWTISKTFRSADFPVAAALR